MYKRILDLLEADSEPLADQLEEEGITPEGSLVYRIYRGKAAEHRVVSELLWRGFNASIMSVDEGTDVIAIKKQQLYVIQVKTGRRYEGRRYQFLFRISSLKKRFASNTLFVLVLRSSSIHFLIFPSSWIRRQVSQGRFRHDKKTKCYAMVVVEHGGKFYLNNRNSRLENYTDNWKLFDSI